MIKVALFMTMNHEFTKYSGIMNLFQRLNKDNEFEVHLLYKDNVPDSVKLFINEDNKFIHTPYESKYVNGKYDYFDYIVTIDPYYGPYCKGSGYNGWKMSGKLVFCEYGVTGLDSSIDYLFKTPVYKRADIIITDTEDSRDKIIATDGVHADVIVGNPEFDYVCKTNGDAIAWTPHCSVYNSAYTKKILGDKHYSTFMTYKDLFTDVIPQMYSSHQFIYKLHPSLGDRIKFMNNETNSNFNLDEWIKRAESIPNVRVTYKSEPYHNVFDQSCLMLNDSISFIAEYLVTGKPMLILRDATTSPFSVHAENIIKHCYYSVSSGDDIRRMISILLISDPKKDAREYYLKKYYKNGEDSNCDRIIRYLKESI